MTMPDTTFSQDAPDLQRVTHRGRQQGLGNLWRREGRSAWGGFRWLFTAAIWLLIIDGITAASAVAPLNGSEVNGVGGVTHVTLDLYFWVLFSIIFTCAGTIISAQNQIIGERQSGAAAWIMSKPVTISAFILSKGAALPKLLLTQVGLPFALALVIINGIAGALPSLTALLFAVGLTVGLNCFFYCLTLLLGTLFRNRTPVLGTSFFGLFIVLQASSTPLMRLLVDLAKGQAVAAASEIVGGVLLVAALLLWGAIWRFGREEFSVDLAVIANVSLGVVCALSF